MIQFDISDPYGVRVTAYAMSVQHSVNKRASVPISADRKEQRHYFGHPRDEQFGISSHATDGIVKVVRFSLLIAKHL